MQPTFPWCHSLATLRCVRLFRWGGMKFLPPHIIHSLRYAFHTLPVRKPKQTHPFTQARAHFWEPQSSFVQCGWFNISPPTPNLQWRNVIITCRTSATKNRQMKSLSLWMQLLSDHKKKWHIRDQNRLKQGPINISARLSWKPQGHLSSLQGPTGTDSNVINNM